MTPLATLGEQFRALAHRLLHRLSAQQFRRPWVVLLVVAAVTVPMGRMALRLKLKTDFAELLPENKASVIEMQHVRTHLSSASTLSMPPRRAAMNATRRGSPW